MEYGEILYTIGFILVALYLLMGLDDFVWDIVTLFRRRIYKKQRLNLHRLDSTPPKLLAIAIAAWHEDNVLGEVVDNIIASVHYPKSMYHLFIGVYPNDEATIAVAEKLDKTYANVHIVINELPGPTSKAQNINYVIRKIKDFEAEHQWEFAALTVHDSEDVVHPYEFKVTNYLLDTHPAMQFPVFPLMQMPKFRNFFQHITSGTYADEFAENHFTTMVGRYSSGAFVPSAGTGFALSREILELFGDEDVLPKDSLTEDYRLSLTLFEKGIQMYYVLEQVPRINREKRLVWDFIATRSMFPNSFKTAVKQKTRWILGITMQSFRFRDIFKTKKIRFVGRYSLYKDFKAKIGNVLALAGYPVLIYFFCSLFIPLEPIYPIFSLSWFLGVIVTCMMVERQIFRGVSIYKVYGFRSVFFACLFPPLMPIRLVWGNIINLVSTLRAYRQSIFGNQTPAKKERKQRNKAEKGKENSPPKLVWAKTEHQFLEKQVLKRYHRNLGDILLEKGYLSAAELPGALQSAADSGQTLGGYLLGRGTITEEQLLGALSHVKHIQYVEIEHLDDYPLSRFASVFDESLLRKLMCIPLLKTKDGYVIAFCDKSHIKAQSILRKLYYINVKAVFVSQEALEKGLDIIYGDQSKTTLTQSFAMELYEKGVINYEQLILVGNFVHKTGKSERKILDEMGFKI